jgi:RimK family alpha-L-glutamate ligase
MRFAVVARHVTSANEALAAHAPPETPGLILTPEEALASLHAGDVALARIDVAPTLDGMEPGLDLLLELEQRGVRVLNRPEALLAAHDKLLTARALEAANLPHPRTQWIPSVSDPVLSKPPLVVKPRFGSWGRDVLLCPTDAELDRVLTEVSDRPWFRADGALVQEFVPGPGFDLRLVVASGLVVGAIERVAAEGEWRTNISLGGRRRRVASVPFDAAALAIATAEAVGLELAGVDLLPAPGGWVVLEVNGAVEFTEEYGLGRSPFAAAMEALLPAEPAVAAALASA